VKNPRRYQLSEYDCGPTSLLNAMSYLFQREEIPPEIVRNIMLYCLDCYGSDGTSGKSGTSHMAMMFLSNWLNGFGQAGHLPISSRYLSGRAVNLDENGEIRDALRRGGAVVALVDFDGWHYVLFTKISGDLVYIFDPYYRDKPFSGEDIQMVADRPMDYNRVVPSRYFQRETREVYSFGPMEQREAVLLFNENTRLTAEATVEYMI
jgi:hypothetical protein